MKFQSIVDDNETYIITDSELVFTYQKANDTIEWNNNTHSGQRDIHFNRD